MSRFANRKWTIITLADHTTEQLQTLVDNALEGSIDTLRRSVNGTKTFFKWDGDTPSCFNGMTTHNHSEILAILGADEWTPDEEI
jgi:uncharacterized heparinase superfamily protein